MLGKRKRTSYKTKTDPPKPQTQPQTKDLQHEKEQKYEAQKKEDSEWISISELPFRRGMGKGMTKKCLEEQLKTIPTEFRHPKTSLYAGIVYPHEDWTYVRSKWDGSLLLNPRLAKKEQRWDQKREENLYESATMWKKKFQNKYPTIEAQEAWLHEWITQHQGSLLPNDYYRDDCSFVNTTYIQNRWRLLGLYTKKPIRKGELIGFYLGKKYTEKEWTEWIQINRLDTIRQDMYHRTAYAFGYKVVQGKTKNGNPRYRQYILDGFYEKDATFLRYINCPLQGEFYKYENCGFTTVAVGNHLMVGVFPLCTISMDSELCASYGDTFYFTRYDLVMKTLFPTDSFEWFRRSHGKKWTLKDEQEAREYYAKDCQVNPWIVTPPSS